MATTLSMNTLRAAVGWNFEETQNWANSANSSSFTYSKTLSNGTGAGSANKIYIVQDTTGIAAAGTLDIDLQDLTDMYGTSISFSKIKVFYIEVTTTTAGVDLVIGNAAATEWIHSSAFMNVADSTITIPAGACMLLLNTDADGWAVAAGYKNLLFTNASGSAALAYKLVIAGE